MRYEITLRLTYKYAHQAANGRHILRLVPRSVAGMQRVGRTSVEILPVPVLASAYTDFFGNACQMIQYRDDHDSIAICLKTEVERQFTPARLDFTPPLERLPAHITECLDIGPESPLHGLGASPRIPDPGAFRAFALSAVLPGMNTLEAVGSIAAALGAHMTFDSSATDVDTPPDVAFARQRGVCQDYSHIMIASLRALGIPAGYVSGFLRTTPPPGKARLAGADAMHAWIRFWGGTDIGWCEYDPTNSCAVSDDHILIGYGRDYSDVSPIRGVSRMTGGQVGHHTVDVVPLV